jgi:hypothetical protein
MQSGDIFRLPQLTSSGHNQDTAATSIVTCTMDDTVHTTLHQISIADLPDEILLDIFGCSGPTFPIHDPSEYRKPGITDASDRLEFLGTNRLVCRTFNRLISPLLCPVVSVSLCPRSIDRLEGLSRNPLIAQGIRGVRITLLFRPRTIASDLQRYHAYADSVLMKLERTCDWKTEFQEYHQDNTSNDATIWRNYHEARTRIRNIRSAWKDLFERRSSQEQALNYTAFAGRVNKGGQGFSADEDVEEAHAILTSCFGKYAAAHVDETRIVSSGSLVRGVVRALSRCNPVPFVWFNEDQPGGEGLNCNAITIANDRDALTHTLTQGHDWLSIEEILCKDDDDTGLFFPASVLTELPIACHSAAVHLRGISVDCFPLLRGYHCLLPHAIRANGSIKSDPWVRFTAACQNLEIFKFGMHGMTCSPVRPARQSPSDLAIINGFIGAATSGPHLQILHMRMTPFRVRPLGRHPGEMKEEHFYIASPILAGIKSTQLRSIALHNIDISEQALLNLVESASPRHLTDLYLAGMTLSSGRYALAMSQLHKIVLSRRNNNGSKPNIHFNTLQGAEFGEPSTFDDGDNDWMLGSGEEQEAFWDRLEKYQRPKVLEQLEQWILDEHATEGNPLSKLQCRED